MRAETQSTMTTEQLFKEKPPVTRGFVGAGDQIRTGDPHLGKVILAKLGLQGQKQQEGISPGQIVFS